ncbi:hypothetical protein EN873_46605 [bacterium M00.F.Ca.ET.230.01.1.1]|nr:hypothetical protein EN873_46605 [bacterium M00.F.Ca.ET.230.01.1.1]
MVGAPINAEGQPVLIKADTDAPGKVGRESEAARSPGGPAEFDRLAPRLKAMASLGRPSRLK